MTLTKHKPKWNLLGSDSRYFLISGGRGSGKSFEVARYLLFLTFCENQKILFTRYTMTSAHLSIIPEFIEKIQLLNAEHIFYITKNEIINKQTGSSIIFRGIKTSSGDQTANLKSLQGITTWVVDEAEELTEEHIFDKIDLSIRTKGIQNKVILILNPTTKKHWIYNRFFLNVNSGFCGTENNTTYIHSTYLDNIENINTSFLNRIEEIKRTNPTKFEHIILGGWLAQMDNVIYTNWEFGEFDDSLPFVFGIDFGFNPDPDAMLRVAFDKSKKIAYICEHIYKRGLQPSELTNLVSTFAKRNTVIADSAEPRLIEMLKRGGVNITPVSKAPNSVMQGIKLVQDWKLIVTKDSTNLATELNNYYMKNGVPCGEDHLLDAMRYCFMHIFGAKTNSGARIIKY